MVEMLSSYIQGGFKIFKDNLVISYILVKVFQNNTYEMFTFLTNNYYVVYTSMGTSIWGSPAKRPGGAFWTAGVRSELVECLRFVRLSFNILNTELKFFRFF